MTQKEDGFCRQVLPIGHGYQNDRHDHLGRLMIICLRFSPSPAKHRMTKRGAYEKYRRDCVGVMSLPN